MSLIFGAIAGFVTAVITEVSKFFIHRENKKHELQMMALRANSPKPIEQTCESHNDRRYEDYDHPIYRNSGIQWVDAINALIRPLITIILICLYTFIRVMSQYDVEGGPYWTDEDTTLLTAIISYYFGQRAVSKNYV